MSSWNKPIYKVKSNKDVLQYTTQQAGFTSIFNNFLYTYLHAKKLKQPLYVYDKNNPISLNYHILKESFIQPSNIIYIDQPFNQTNTISQSMIRALTGTIQNATLQEEAAHLFRLTPEMTTCIQSELSTYSFPTFDIGVHIRSGDKITTGEMRAIPINSYIKEINAIKSKDTTNVFVMTDNIILLEALKKGVSQDIHIYSMNQNSPCASGHNQGIFNLSIKEVKLKAYIQFMTELYTMQKIPNIICTFSSNIGRYLYLTSPSITKFTSLDIKVFVAL